MALSQLCFIYSSYKRESRISFLSSNALASTEFAAVLSKYAGSFEGFPLTSLLCLLSFWASIAFWTSWLRSFQCSIWLVGSCSQPSCSEAIGNFAMGLLNRWHRWGKCLTVGPLELADLNLEFEHLSKRLGYLAIGIEGTSLHKCMLEWVLLSW